MKLSHLIFLSCCSAILIVPVNSALAQVWRDGFVVMAGGDTLKGQVEFTDPDRSVAEVNFRISPTSAAITYEKEEVTSFGLSSPEQTFVVISVQIKYYSRGVVKEGNNPVLAVSKLEAYAEVIASSRSIALYSLYDQDRQERFFVKKDNELTELENVSYLLERGDKTFMVKDTRYQGQLRSQLSDCRDGQKAVYSYDAGSLGKAVSEYIQCKGEGSAEMRGGSRPQFMFGPFGTWILGTANGVGFHGLRAGATAQVLSRKNNGNQFVWLEAGWQDFQGEEASFYFGAHGGTYIGTRQVQPLIAIGVTSRGSHITIGVAARKRILLTAILYIPTRPNVWYTGIRLAVVPRLGKKR